MCRVHMLHMGYTRTVYIPRMQYAYVVRLRCKCKCRLVCTVHETLPGCMSGRCAMHGMLPACTVRAPCMCRACALDVTYLDHVYACGCTIVLMSGPWFSPVIVAQRLGSCAAVTNVCACQVRPMHVVLRATK